MVFASGDHASMLYGTFAADRRVLVPRSPSWIHTSSTSFSFATIATYRPSGDNSGNGHCSCAGPIGAIVFPVRSTQNIRVIRDAEPCTWTSVPSRDTLGTSALAATRNGSPVVSCLASEKGTAHTPVLAGWR